MDGGRARGLRWLSLALLVGLWLDFALSLPATTAVTTNDLPAYRSAGRHVLLGEPQLLYGTDKDFTNLPIVAVLMTPLAKLGYPAAFRLFWWLQVASFVACFGLLLALLRRHFPPLDPPRAAVVAAVLLCFAPLLRRCLVLGQTTPMLVAALAGVSWLARAGRERWAGALLGGIALVKIPPILLIAVFGLRRRFALAGSALAVLAAGVLLSAVLFGPALLARYADVVIWDNFGRSLAAFNNQSLEGAFMRALGERGLADWSTVPRPPLVTAAVSISALALLGALFASDRLFWLAGARDDRDLELELAIGCALMVLLFPVVWMHYYLFLAVPFALLPFWWQRRGFAAGPALLVLYALGIWLASGSEVLGNAYYAEREGELAFRLDLDRQPLGAVLLLASCAVGVSRLRRRGAAP